MNDYIRKLEEHVSGMFLIGETEEEVREWLWEKKGVDGPEADWLVERGWRKRRHEVRMRAILRLVFAGAGVILFAGFVLWQVFGEIVVVGIPVLLVYGVGGISFLVFFQAIHELVTGNTKRSLQ